MPLYEYRCSKCHRVFEVLQKFADAPLAVHEGCGGEVERLISAPAFHLKGTGWYATDYKKAPAAPVAGKTEGGGEAKADGDASSTESKSESTKSESKSNEQSESKSSSSESSSTPAPASAKAD